MTYYPVGIPTLCRYEHFKRCVESLARNTHADKTELVIGLDYPPSEKYMDGYVKINRYVDTIDGFAKVTIFRHKENLGAIDNYNYIMDYIFKHYDAAITTEDDNVFAPCFLDYMNKCLNKYKLDKHISSVSGFKFYNFQGYKDFDVLQTYISSAWGMGTWRDKLKIINAADINYYENEVHKFSNILRWLVTYPDLISLMSRMVENRTIWGDVCYTFDNIKNNTFQIVPVKSLVQNWGHDGSGEHCGNSKNTDQFTPRLPTVTTYDVNKVAPISHWATRRGQILGLHKTNYLRRTLSILRILIEYIVFRFK